MTIKPDGRWLGMCTQSEDGEAAAPSGRLNCVLCLVGPAADHSSSRYGGSLYDFDKFLSNAEDDEEQDPVGHRDTDDGQVLREIRRSDDPEVLYEAARTEAEAFVDEHWSEIVAIAERLMEAETLTEREVDAALGRPGWGSFREMLDESRLADETAPWVLLEGADEEMF